MQKKSFEEEEEEEEEFGPKWTVKYEQGEEERGKATLSMPSLSRNGHYSKPRNAYFPGVDVFLESKCTHRRIKEPSVFTNQNVVLIGAQASGEDIFARYRHKSGTHLSAKIGKMQSGGRIQPYRRTCFENQT